MATVEKLLIKGVRSFSPENSHVITFPKPLTLIVGRNGSGKTVRHPARVLGSSIRGDSAAMCASRRAGGVGHRGAWGLPGRLPSPLRAPALADHHRVPEACRHRRVAAQLPLRQVVRARPQGASLGTQGEATDTAPGAQACRLPLQVYGADEVKAQIKLQCKTVTGKPFLVIRSFQLTRKRGSGKYEFKSLDQNIQIMKNNGEVRGVCRRSGRRAPARGADAARLPCSAHQLEGISKRCVDINQEVPLLMGVSKVCGRGWGLLGAVDARVVA
jgi:hypothetical protein